jgi:hypothetical protein
MLYQVDDALLHAMSGIELSRGRTELRLLLPEAYQQKSDRVERGRHCYAIKWLSEIRRSKDLRDKRFERRGRRIFCRA